MANWAGSAIDGLLCYCRAGFEPELAGELTERAAQAGFAGYARTERNTANHSCTPSEIANNASSNKGANQGRYFSGQQLEARLQR